MTLHRRVTDDDMEAVLEARDKGRMDNEHYETEKGSVLDEIDALTKILLEAAENQTDRAAERPDQMVKLRHSVFVDTLNNFSSRINVLLEFNKSAGAEARADVLRFIQTKADEVKQGVKNYISTKENEKLQKRSRLEQNFTIFCKKLIDFIKLVEDRNQKAAYDALQEINYKFRLSGHLEDRPFSNSEFTVILNILGAEIGYDPKPTYKEFVKQDLTEFKKIIDSARTRWLDKSGLNALRELTPNFVEPNPPIAEAATPAP